MGRGEPGERGRAESVPPGAGVGAVPAAGGTFPDTDGSLSGPSPVSRAASGTKSLLSTVDSPSPPGHHPQERSRAPTPQVPIQRSHTHTRPRWQDGNQGEGRGVRPWQVPPPSPQGLHPPCATGHAVPPTPRHPWPSPALATTAQGPLPTPIPRKRSERVAEGQPAAWPLQGGLHNLFLRPL